MVATTSGRGAAGEKAALARQAGADHVGVAAFTSSSAATVRRRHPAAAAATSSTTASARRPSTTAWRRCTPRGMMVLYGAASGQVPPLDPQLLNYGGSLFLTRPTLVHYIADRDELLWRAGDLFGWMAEGVLDVRIGGTYPLADAARAHEDLGARRTTGKLLLLP